MQNARRSQVYFFINGYIHFNIALYRVADRFTVSSLRKLIFHGMLVAGIENLSVLK